MSVHSLGKMPGYCQPKISFYLLDMVLQGFLFHENFSPPMCVCSIEG